MALKRVAGIIPFESNISKPKSSVAFLYRTIIRELPRVLILYDVGMSPMEARKSIRYHFTKNAFVTDQRVIDRLVVKAYMELEETIMQWKQQNHLMKLLQPRELVQESEMEVLDEEVDEVMEKIQARVHRRE